MRDDLLTRDWNETDGSLPDGIGRLFQTVAAGLARLNARQFDAPWHRDVDGQRTTGARCG